MITTIIPASSLKSEMIDELMEVPYLKVSEFYCDTIQGEGSYIGHPATFLRLTNCSLNCIYCDSKEVWRKGNPYSFQELFDLMDLADLPRKLHEGQHLVITGGSPLLQQNVLVDFLHAFISLYKFKPFIEIENEAVIMPSAILLNLVDCWNNSPKLMSSGMTNFYKLEVIKILAAQQNSWFKFVISKKEDWKEIINLYGRWIKKEQIILMPEGAAREEIKKNQEVTLQMAIMNGVRYSDRLHIALWGKKVGV
jgi:organic radical activating enzyme